MDRTPSQPLDPSGSWAELAARYHEVTALSAELKTRIERYRAFSGGPGALLAAR